MNKILLSISTLLIGLLSLRIGHIEELFYTILITASCLACGLPLTKIILKNQHRITSLSISFFLGLTFNTYFIAITILILGWNLPFIATQLAITTLMGIALYKMLPSKEAPTFKQERTSFFGTTIVLASIFIPLWNLGQETANGYAFASIFSHDFLFRIGYTGHVARGLSDESIFMAGLNMPNQYLFYVFPATIYHFAGKGSDLIAIFKYIIIMFAVALPLLLSDMLYRFKLSDRTALVTLVLAFLSYSFSGIAVLVLREIASMPWGLASSAADALAKEQTLLSQSWIRDILVEPHSVMGIAIAIICLSVISQMGRSDNNGLAFFIIGAASSICFGMDSFLGVICLALCATFFSFNIIKHPTQRSTLVISALHLMLFGSVTLALFHLMGIFNPFHSSGTLFFKPYNLLISIAPAYLTVEYGATMLAACASLFHWRKINTHTLVPLIALTAICLFFMFFIQHAEANVVQRKSGKLLFLAALIMTAFYIEHSAKPPSSRLKTYLQYSFYCLIFVGFLNSILNTVILSRTDTHQSASFIKADDYRAIRWVIENTPAESVIQSLPEYYPLQGINNENYRISLFSQLGERKMALGNRKFANYTQTENDTSRDRHSKIVALFSTNSAKEAHMIAKRYQIDYIFLGTYENENHPNANQTLSSDSQLFKKVYDVNGVKVFKVLGI